VLSWLFEAWKAYAHRAGSYQTRLLLTLVYLVVLGPAALLAKALGGQLMDLDGTPGKSTWRIRAAGANEATLNALRRQF
jgi:hypothetical protein